MPVVRGGGRELTRLLIPVLVGVIAFGAGLQLGAGPSTHQVPPSAAASVASTATPTAAPSGTSEFFTTFDPSRLFATITHGDRCAIEVNQIEEQGVVVTAHRSVRVWTVFCSLPVADRAALLDALVMAIGHQVPGQSSSGSSGDQVSTVWLFPYEQGPSGGTLILTADDAGSGYEIAITLEELLIR